MYRRMALLKCVFLLGYAFVDFARNHVANAVKIVGIADVLLARKLYATGYIPKPEPDFNTIIGLATDMASDQFLCAGSAPIGKIG
jgi:hypothetical protein